MVGFEADGTVSLGKQEPKLTELPTLDTSTTSLDCSCNNLAALPAALGTLGGLVKLDASDNQLTSLPEELCKCEKLEELLLFRNRLQSVPAQLGELNSLRTLNLFNNKLTKLPETLGGVYALEEVNVAANRLMTLSEATCACWSAVRVLNLFDNRLVKLTSLASLSSLVELRIYNNSLEALPVLPASSALEVLEAHNNRLAIISEGYFLDAPELKRLLLQGNQLEALPPSLASCSKLQFLQVGDNQIGELRASDEQGRPFWPELQTLFLERNPLASLPTSLLAYDSLSRCNLSGCSLDVNDEVAAQLLKMMLSRPGGNFWGVNGRRWQSGEHKAAAWAEEGLKRPPSRAPLARQATRRGDIYGTEPSPAAAVED